MFEETRDVQNRESDYELRLIVLSEENRDVQNREPDHELRLITMARRKGDLFDETRDVQNGGLRTSSYSSG